MVREPSFGVRYSRESARGASREEAKELADIAAPGPGTPLPAPANAKAKQAKTADVRRMSPIEWREALAARGLSLP